MWLTKPQSTVTWNYEKAENYPAFVNILQPGLEEKFSHRFFGKKGRRGNSRPLLPSCQYVISLLA